MMMKEALAYFSDGDHFRRLFSLFKKKYESLGRIGGTVKLEYFSDEELDALARFLGVTDKELRRKGNVSLEKFEQQLQSTRFEGVHLKELLEAYFGETLLSKKEMKEKQDEETRQFFIQLNDNFPALRDWLNHVRKKPADTYWIYRLIEESKPRFIKWMERLEKAITHLPEQYERLPLFSQRITRDPHAFDQNTNLGRLFIHMLSIYSMNDRNVFIPSTSEGINDLLLSHRILRDDITNYVTCANIIGETESGAHPMWQAAAETHSVMNVPLRELVDLSHAYPANHGCDVWIVENSGVYSSLLDELPSVPLLCTHGQFKLAGLVLIDLLVQEGCTIHYAGDIDPEGLNMAERLLLRHPSNVRIWKMDLESYKKSITEVELSTDRLQKLASITSSALIPVANELRRKKKAGYQEALVPDMVQELMMYLG